MAEKWVGQATTQTLAAVRDENAAFHNRQYLFSQESLSRMKSSPQIKRMMEDVFSKTFGQSFPYVRIYQHGIGFNYEKGRRVGAGFRDAVSVRFKDYDIADIVDIPTYMAFVEFVCSQIKERRGHVYRVPAHLIGCGTSDLFVKNGFKLKESLGDDCGSPSAFHQYFSKHISIDGSIFTKEVKRLEEAYSIITTAENSAPNFRKPYATDHYAVWNKESFWGPISSKVYILNTIHVNWEYAYPAVELECADLLPKDDKIYRW